MHLFCETKFVTLASTDDIFVIHGSIKKINSYPALKDAPVEFTQSIPNFTMVRFTKTGYFSAVVIEDNKEFDYSIFVSPVPSVHADKIIADMDWYQTQFDSGAKSNCGPASCAMGISWARGALYPVSAVRGAVGWRGDGSTTFEELIRVIKANDISAALVPLRTFYDIKNIIDEGAVAIILFKTSGVSTAHGNPVHDLFGKYYEDDAGHYVVVKGYSEDGRYIIVHDPIPSDWALNTARYNDGLSMIGKNRYYNAGELLKSLRRSDMIVVRKPTS